MRKLGLSAKGPWNLVFVSLSVQSRGGPRISIYRQSGKRAEGFTLGGLCLAASFGASSRSLLLPMNWIESRQKGLPK
jgi:hypothetical protein